MHSAEVARAFAYAATNGNEGTLGPDDLKVLQLATAGASVNINAGAAVVPCRAAGQGYQSYIGRCPTQDNIGVAGTGATARSDMVIARVEDPWLAGEPWPDPAAGSEAVGPYIYTRLLSGVPSSAIANWEAARAYLIAQNFSAIPLAGINQPISNSAVLQSQIVDLRRVANPRRERRVYTSLPSTKTSVTGTSSFADWFGSWSVSVPFWASRAVINLEIGGVVLDRQDSSNNGTSVGQIQVVLGTLTTQSTAYNEFAPKADSSGQRTSEGCADTLIIPTTDRGQVRTLKIQAKRTSGNQFLYVDAYSYASLDVEFQEVAG